MKRMTEHIVRAGFALPTVLIASVVMLAILSASVAAATTTRAALMNQYYENLANDAADSGLQMAKECIEAGYTTWANPLRPGGTCAGLAAPCTTSSCYLVNTTNVRTSFEASPPIVAGDISGVKVKGITERLRTTGGGVVRSYSHTIRKLEVSASTSSFPLLWAKTLAGSAHTCGLASNKSVYCWGLNTNGRLGDGTSTQRTVPTAILQGAVPAGETARELIVGNSHSCMIATNNQAYCWGFNTSGGLGDNSTTHRTSPVAVAQGALPAGSTIRQLALGGHSCAIASDNKPYCWGNNPNGQLGDSSTTQRNTPVAVAQGAMPAGVMVRDIAVGSNHSCAIASDNKIYCWGLNTNGQLGDNSTAQRTAPVAVAQGAMPAGATIRKLSLGQSHSCAIATDNKAYCWGLNTNGQLGDSSTTQRTTPVAVAQGAMPAGVTIRELSVGATHSCAITTLDQTYCWGLNASGQLGDGTTTQRTTPVAVAQGAVPAGLALKELAIGQDHSCAIAVNSRPYCWGLNSNGRLGDGSTTQRTTPVAVNTVSAAASAPAIMSMAAGGAKGCLTADNNKTYCWGHNQYAALGDGTTTSRSTPVEMLQGALPAGLLPRSSSPGAGSHACHVGADSWAYCVGRNANGRLGDGTTTQRSSPVAVAQGAIPAGAKILQVGAGGDFSCALASDHKAYCWGNNQSGQLGRGNTTASSTPVAVLQGTVPAGVTFREIAVGSTHTCAIGSDNKSYCWGEGTVGQYGNGTTGVTNTVPQTTSQGTIPATATIKQISAGNNYTCVVATNNNAYCWGLLTGSTITSTPGNMLLGAAAPAGTTVRDIQVGTEHICALGSNNLVYCRGEGSYGRLGDGTQTDRTAFVAVLLGAMPAGATVQQLFVGGASNCVLASNNQYYCWGMNLYGQVGDGTTTDRLTPVLFSGPPAYPTTAQSTYYF